MLTLRGVTLEEAIGQFVPTGFRDDVGVWHEGPHQARALSELERLRWTIVELASHVHDCETLISPRSMRTVSEIRATLASREAA